MSKRHGDREETASAAEVLRSLLFYAAFYGGTLLVVIVAVPLMAFAPPWLPRYVAGWAWYHRLCARWLLGIRVRVEGERPADHAFVAMKHESFFEAIDMPLLLDYPVIFAKAELMRIPLWGRAANGYGLISVEREAGAKALRAMVAAARRLTGGGRLLAIFPEGTRVPHGKAPPLQSGFAGVYKLLGLPVVPAAVDSGRLYHRRWKRAGTITVRFGAPILPGLRREAVEAQVHAAINALNGLD